MLEFTRRLDREGGPAFGSGSPEHGGHPGMSLRDYFAGAAVSGLLANSGGPIQHNGQSGWGIVNCKTGDIAGLCYELADAMLAARETETN